MTSLLCIIETKSFLAAAERLMSEEERWAIVDLIAAHPGGGVVVPGTNGLRKLRTALKGRGKRGGGRVIYWYHSKGYPAALLTVFAKSEAPDLTHEQRRNFVAIGAAILAQFGAPS